MLSQPNNRGAPDDTAGPNITALIAAMRAGPPQLTAEVVAPYFQAIAVRANVLILRHGIQRLIAGEDVANDVLLDMHDAVHHGKFAVVGEIELVRIVCKMVTRRVVRARRAIEAMRRGGQALNKPSAVADATSQVVDRPIPLHDPPVDFKELAAQLPDPSPSPEALAAANDEARRLSRMQMDPVWPEILRLRLVGYSIAEVARKTGRSFSSVQRQLYLVWTRWGDSRNSD